MFTLGIEKIVLVPDGILVHTPSAIRTISFADELYHMALLGLLVRCLYSKDDPVVGSRNTLA